MQEVRTLRAEVARLAADPRDRAARERVAAEMDAVAVGPPSGERKISPMTKSAPTRKTLLEPGHEAEWAKINREKRDYHHEQVRALTPSERVAQGQKLSQQAVQLLASTIRRGHVSPRSFWS
jgi:mannose/cellobiose epimerase-like protein (N-acyl-D-glucosamine 2-epimerase family)